MILLLLLLVFDGAMGDVLGGVVDGAVGILESLKEIFSNKNNCDSNWLPNFLLRQTQELYCINKHYIYECSLQDKQCVGLAEKAVVYDGSGVCVAYYPAKTDWFTAQDNCANRAQAIDGQLCGRLVRVPTAAIQQWLSDTFPNQLNARPAWIGRLSLLLFW